MHEFSVMSEIVKIANTEAEKHHATEVLELTLEVGELTLLSKPQLEFAFEVLREGTLLGKAELKFRDSKARLKCPSCQRSMGMEELKMEGVSAYYAHFVPLICPGCKAKMDVEQGKELSIREMKMNVED